MNQNYPRVKAISWFNWNKPEEGDFRLQRVPEQARAYAADVAAPRYLDSAASLIGGNSQPVIPRLDVPSREIILRDVTPVINPRPVAAPIKRSVLDGIKWQNVPTERVPTKR